LHDFYVSIHNTYCLINVLALQAMLNNALGDEPAALATLERAIIMAEAGGFIRIFLDLGPKMAVLLQQLAERDVASKYIGSLLAASQESESGLLTDSSGHQPVDIAASNDPTLLESLSNRELDVLSLLSQRLSNKEVSGKLFISPETVKRHTINLYKKLDVHTRREAVDKAVSLGILS
jgi:LuxR family maltose regulon positive regulatory protein